MPSRSQLRSMAMELMHHFLAPLTEATNSSVTSLSNRQREARGRSAASPATVSPFDLNHYVEAAHQGQASPSTASSRRGRIPEVCRRNQVGSQELDDLPYDNNNTEGGGVQTPNLDSPMKPGEDEAFSVSSTSSPIERKVAEAPGRSPVDEQVDGNNDAGSVKLGGNTRKSASKPEQEVRRSVRLMAKKSETEKPAAPVKRKPGRPKKRDKSPLKEGSPTRSETPPEVTKPITEEEKEELMWERLAKLESRQETNAKKKKTTTSSSRPKSPREVGGGEDSDLEEHFCLSLNLEDEETNEFVVDQPDEFRPIWRDADFAIGNSIDNLMEKAKRMTLVMQTDDFDCDHEFAFKEDIGKVCIDCGYVDKLVTQHFELTRSFKRRRTLNNNNNNTQLDDVGSLRRVETKEDTFDEVVEFNPSAFHLKRMHEHQKEGFRFLVKNLFGEDAGGVFLHHAPGTGKTFLVVSFLQTYFYKFPGRRALIAAPKNMLEPWEREFEKWQVDPIPVKVLFGDDKLSIVSNWYDGAGVLLVTPNMLALLLDERKNDPSIQEIRQMLIEGPDILVVDEAHVARNRTAKIFSSLKNVKTRQRIFLSGTAFQNNLDEVLNLLRLCRPNFIDRSPEYALTPDKGQKQFFRESVQDRLAVDRAGAIRAFRSLTEPFLQWYGGKVLEKLPGLEDFIVMLKLSDVHMMRVKQYVPHSGKNFMAEDHKLAQACVHPCLADERFYKLGQDPYAGMKTAFIIELLRFVGASERLIIFCQFKKPLTLLKQLLEDEFNWSVGTEVLHIDGDTARSERMIIMDVFNSPKTKARVLLASLKTCGEGISLVGGSRVVVLDIAWNPSVVSQAVSRAFRIGQTKKVYVYRLLATDTDEVDKLRSSMDKQYLGRALFDTGFTIDTNSCMPTELSSSSDISDKFLSRFVQSNMDKCVVKSMRW